MRKILLSSLLSLAILVVPAVGQAATKVSYKAAGEQQVLALLNQIRQQNGLSALTLSIPLRNAARAHSADMLQKNYFQHDGLTETWSARVARYLKSPLTGENIAWGSGSYGSPAGIVSQWMHSTVHRQMILTAGFHRVGLGLAERYIRRHARLDHGHGRLLRVNPMNFPESPIRAAVTRARIERVIARLPELSEERLEGIEATLFEAGELRATCRACGQLYRPYLERCATCRTHR